MLKNTGKMDGYAMYPVRIWKTEKRKTVGHQSSKHQPTSRYPSFMTISRNSYPHQFHLFFIQISYSFIFKSYTHIHTKKNKFQDGTLGPW
jgi:hypothetical protein